MRTFLRFVLLLALAVWIGGMIWIGPVFAGYLFTLPERGSEWVPHTHAAGDLIAPLLAGIERTAWVVIPICLACIALLARLGARLGGARLQLAPLALVAALGISLYNGLSLFPEIREIRLEVAAAEGPEALVEGHPRYAEFDAKHELSTRLFSIDLLLALVALGCAARVTSRDA